MDREADLMKDMPEEEANAQQRMEHAAQRIAQIDEQVSALVGEREKLVARMDEDMAELKEVTGRAQQIAQRNRGRGR